MEINPSEITKILKEQIKNLGDKTEVSEIDNGGLHRFTPIRI